MIYLNNAATSYPKPECVHRAVREYVESVPFHALRAGSDSGSKDPIERCRGLLARLFNVPDANNIVLTSGATSSLNLAICGLDLAGGHVVTTAVEHNSVLRPLKRLESEGRIGLAIVGCDREGRVSPGAVADALTPATRAVVVSHASNVSGAVNDIAAIAAEVHRIGAVIVVDAAQSAGVEDIDVLEMDLDLVAFTGHKSLCGYQGTGGLYVRPEIRLRPLQVGGTGVRSDLMHQPEDIPMYYECGTPNSPGIASLAAGVQFVLDTGLATIRRRKGELTTLLVDGLQSIPRVVVYGPTGADGRSGLVSFNIEGISPADAGFMLESGFEIIIRSGLHCAPLIHRLLGAPSEGSVRVSPSYFTTDEEIVALLDAVRQMSRAGVMV